MIQDNKICTVYLNKENLYSFPGGGVDLGESPEQGMKREMLEETGYEVEIIDEIGMTVEYLYEFNVLQMTYAYLVQPITNTNTNKIALTESEIEAGLEIQWLEIDQILARVKKNKITHAGDVIMQKRALILIDEIKNKLT
jgi:8-oxo-dGTP pyrophosphatase MutT (NUDIX family)